MRLSWKLFCSMVLIAALALSLGGYALIYSQLSTNLNREVTALLEEGDLLRYALASEAGSPADAEELVALAQGLAASTTNRDIPFALRDGEGALLMASPTFADGASPVADQLTESRRGWVLEERDQAGRLLTAVAPLPTAQGTVYLENQRSVNDLYAQRDEQYRLFTSIEAGAVGAVGLLAALLSLWILRPLRRLSAASRAMAQGDLHRRVPVRGNDELSTLSQDFNHMAAQMESQVSALTQAAQRQEDFIGAFAHEIKTPLTSIIGYAELLLARPASDAPTRESAQYIFREGRRLEALSRKLLDLIVLDGQNLARRPVPVAALLAQTAGALEPALAAEGIALTVQADDAVLELDADLVEAACLNLIDNARKACARTEDDRRSAPARITVTGRAARHSYLIAIADNGVGIPADEIARITEAFYMVDKSRSRSQGGAGLGLAICQRIVRLHEGTLAFSSTPGRGTTARIALPRPAHGDGPTAATPDAPAAAPALDTADQDAPAAARKEAPHGNG